MAFTIEIQNLDTLLKRFESYGAKAHHAAWRGVERTAFEVKDEARKNVPVETATLQNSIQITDKDPEKLRATVQTTQPARDYAAYQNYGFFGPMRVREHTRIQWHVWGKRLTKPIEVVVPAHERVYNYEGYGYMNTARLKGQTRIQGNVEAELNAVKL